MTDRRHAYLFEAKGIGRYILSSGKLRDMIGASELVARLAGGEDDDVGRICKVAGVDTPLFSRRAGGSFCLHGDLETLRAFADLWRIYTMSSRPGLEISEAWGSGDTDMAAMKQAYANISGIRENSVASLLPVGGPLAWFAPTTGLPAVFEHTYRSGDEASDVDAFMSDLVTFSQRKLADDLMQSEESGVVARVMPSVEPGTRLRFPRNLEDAPDKPKNPSFPFIGDDRRIAMVHADLSGLGEIFRKATQVLSHPREIAALAEAIEMAIQSAVRDALTSVVLTKAIPHRDDNRVLILPARPVMLGGDDITLLVRSDLALAFTQALLENIETETESQFDHLNSELRARLGEDLPSYLSACAGVAITRPGQPFQFSNALAEDLCKFAKRSVKAGDAPKPYASALAFHVATTTLQEDYEGGVLANDLTLNDGRKLTANPYFVGRKADEGRKMTDLEKLAGTLVAAGGLGALKRMRPALTTGNDTGAKDIWRRWRTVREKDRRAAVDDALAALGVSAEETSGSFFCSASKTTGVYDALELLDLGNSGTEANDAPDHRVTMEAQDD